MDAFAGVNVPYSDCSIRRATYDHVVFELRGPDPARVSYQGLKEFARECAPYFKSAVVGAADNSEAVEFETCYDVVVMAPQNKGLWKRACAPVLGHVVFDEIGAFESIERFEIIVNGSAHELGESRYRDGDGRGR